MVFWCVLLNPNGPVTVGRCRIGTKSLVDFFVFCEHARIENSVHIRNSGHCDFSLFID